MLRTLPTMLLCATLASQTAPCAGQNNTNTNITGHVTPATSVPSVRAYLVTFPSSLVLHGIEIFTGSQGAPGAMKLELWHSHPFSFLPQVRATGGALQLSGNGVGWQGTNLDMVHITAPVSMWLVWTEPGSSFEPYEPGGATVSAAELLFGNWSLRPAVPLKWRFRCNWLDGSNVTVTSNPCWASPRPSGTLFTNDNPTVGNANLLLQGTGFVPGQIAFLALGHQQSPSASLPWSLPANCIRATSEDLILLGATSSGGLLDGHVAFHLPVPPNPLLVGQVAYCQLGVWDPQGTAQLPLQLSNGLRLLVN